MIEPSIAALMRRDFGISLKKVFALESERAALTKFFEENNIWYLTLKGVLLQNLYPKMGMRQMLAVMVAEACSDYFEGYKLNK